MIDVDIYELIKEYEKGESASKLAQKHHVSVWTVLNRLRACGVQIRTFREQNEKKLNLSKKDSKRFIEVVDGLLLSDANIHKKNYLQISQNGSNIPWLYQIQDLFKKIGGECKFTDIKPRKRKIGDRTIHGKAGKLLRTPSYVELQKQRQRWYPNGKKKVPCDIKLTPLLIAMWLCGDGTLDRRSGYITFCTNSFSKKEVSYLAGLFDKIGIRINVNTHRGNEFILRTTRRDESCKIKNLTQKFIPDCFLYKVDNIRQNKYNKKVSDGQVLEMRKMKKAGKSYKQLAEIYGLSIKSVYNIIKRRTYRHL